MIKSINMMKSKSYSDIIRKALLLLSVLIMGAGNVCGQTWQKRADFDGETVILYAKNNGSYQANFSDIVQKKLSEITIENLYVRWDIYNFETRDFLNFAQYVANPLWITCENYNYNSGNGDKFRYYYKSQSWHTFNLNQTLNAVLSFNNIDLENSVLECYVTDDYKLDDENLKSDNTVVLEPKFKLKIEVIFNETGEEPDDFLNRGEAKNTLSFSIPVEASAKSITLTKTDNWPDIKARYVRWYVVDDKGDIYNTTNTILSGLTDFITDDKYKHGMYWHSSTPMSEFVFPTLSIDEAKLDEYHVVAVLSTEEGTVEDGKLKTEPLYDYIYTFNFDYPFKGQVTGITVEKTFQQLQRKWTENNSEFCVEFDFNEHKIFLKNKDGNSNLCEIELNEDFWSSYNDANLSNGQSFYVRWFLRNKLTGAEEYVANSLMPMQNKAQYKLAAKEKYSIFWSNKIGDGQTNLNNIMSVRIDGTPDGGTPFNLTDYDLVCTIGNSGTEQLNEAGQVTTEPEELQIQYVFHLNNQPFEAVNLSMVKTINKSITYNPNEEYVVFEESLLPTLLNVTTDEFNKSNYVRWYIGDAEGNKIDMSKWELVNSNNVYLKSSEYGLLTSGVQVSWGQYDIKVKVPEVYRSNLNDFRIVCLITQNLEGMNKIDSPLSYETEPTNMELKCIFKLEYKYFVHSKGASGRDYIIGANASAKQKTWNEETQSADDINGDIRQGVHTWNYNVYVETDVKHQLFLPLQFYNITGQGLEPRAYFRWYDWKTDYAVVSDDNSFTFFKSGSLLSSMEEFYVGGDGTLMECDRGLMAINISGNACQNLIGTEIMATSGFETYYKNHGSLDIACDVSKYTDGLDGQVLIHEPTLSTRYIYHVYPASVIADNIAVGNAALQNGLGNIANGSTLFMEANNGMFKLLEDKSRVAVSLGGNASQFSLRLDEFTLDNYFVWENSTEKTGLTKCTKVSWWVYYEKDGDLCKRKIKDSEARIETFTKSDIFEQGVERFHIVAYVGNDAMDIEKDQGVYAAVTHYELTFVDAVPLTLDELRNSQNIKRTEEYMNVHYQWANALTFDGDREEVADRPQQYYSTADMYAKPNSTKENMSCEPIEWNEVNYGYCYPQLSKNINDGWSDIGMSPLHGDYMILKSMNVDGISSSGDDEYPLYWWNDGILYDYTHSYKDNNKYGAFMYVDASDETRTLAQMPLKNARLCVGSTIYFTFVVADMTGSNANPQILARVSAKIGGRTVPIVAFHSGEITGNRGKWVQVYGKATIPGSVLDDIKKIDPTLSLSAVKDFEVQIINYANDTEGADYAIDQLSFWFGTSKLNVSQNNGDCDENVNNTLKAYMTGESLQGLLGENAKNKKIYYRICETVTNEVVKGNKMYPRLNDTNVSDEGEGDDGNRTYGEVYVETTDYNASKVLSESNMTQQSGFFKDANDEVYFRLFNRFFTGLQEGKKYYISIYDTTLDIFDENLANAWGNGSLDACSTYSADFVPLRPYLSIAKEGETDEISVIEGECGGNGDNSVTLDVTFKMPDETSPTGYKLVKPHYDYFKGTKEEYLAIKNLMEALDDFRSWDKISNHESDEDYTNYTTGNLEAALEAYKTSGRENAQTYAAVIEENKQKLLLSGSKQFIALLENGTNMFVADAIETQIENVTVCDYTTFSIDYTVSVGSPTMQLGFEDVAYPEDYVRVVRVGREQLLNMQKAEGCLLHVPVNNFNIGSGDDNTGALVFVGNLELLKEGTTDPTINDNNNKVATFAADEEVSAEKMYVSLNFHGEGVTQPDFREGFAYRMFFQVKKKDAGEGACTGNVEFILKVVPEFVTWTGKAGDTNTSWNNDANWTRSKCDELYKKTGQNTPTAAQGDGTDKGEYVDNDAALGQPDTYVPMKFTYVTIPTHNRASVLVALTKGIDGIYNNVESGATENIQYDIMVRTELGCQGGEHHEKVEGYDIYDCEKFYGNCCKEIYFKPEAELVNQQHLTYEKAWVEKELVPAAWYLMSSPLRSVCSGDMFVPKSNGRQETEAFQPIAFDKEKGYSRTKYPVYQRSWKQEGAEVYTNENDMRGASYSANLPYSKSDVIETTMAQWSHVYNDFAVADTTLAGFSIRAHKESQQQNALLRLPKDDWYYQYFQWNENLPKDDYDLGREKWPGSHGKFKTVSSIDGLLTSPISLIQVNNGYALIGNPYMSSVRMSKFLEQNSGMIDGNAFWTYEVSDDGTSTELKAHGGSGTIRPMQAFFVKLRDDVVETDEITFTSDMMIDGNTSPETETAAAGVRMMAINSKGQSTAVVAHVDGSSNGYDVGEDVETFFDSNFSDAPTVYTVAGTKAVSVNSLPNIDIVPFGVTCAGNDAVDVTITGTDLITQKLYVYDAANGMCAEIHDGEPISVQPNDYGRYYLTTRSSMSLDGNIAQGIVVSVRDGHVTVTSAKNISRVVVTTLNGANQLSLADCGMSATFTLHQGVYIIEVEGDAGKNTVKIMVK